MLLAHVCPVKVVHPALTQPGPLALVIGPSERMIQPRPVKPGLSSGTFVEQMDLLPSAHDHMWPPVRQADPRDSRKWPGLVPSVLWSQLRPGPALCILSWLEPVWMPYLVNVIHFYFLKIR